LELRPFAQLDREERPEVIKRRRGVDEARSRGMNVDVKTWVEVTLREYAAFQTLRIVAVEVSFRRRPSKAPPECMLDCGGEWVGFGMECTGVVNQSVDAAVFGFDVFECGVDGCVVFDVELDGFDAGFCGWDFGLECFDGFGGFVERTTAH
jgi:hypothetical protein